jgi:polysaccharide deacetylase family protein (PEP-CTERM system associated)
VTTANAFTVDLEDWYQGLEIDIDDWHRFTPRVERGLKVLLDLLDEARVRATFFVLGHQAERTPALIRDLAARGHEIASHGWTHRFVYRIGRESFRDELRRSKAVLEDLVGAPVVGYRAPFFSITQQSLWALDVLVEEGFRYDSSVFPVLSYRYGIAGAHRRAGPLTTPSGATLFEIPLSTCRLPGLNVPISGGGYFRLYPYALTRALARRLQHQGLPLVFYVHPWEYDVDHPRIQMPRRVPELTHYHNLRSMAPKTRQLLRDLRFTTLRDAYGESIRAAS